MNLKRALFPILLLMLAACSSDPSLPASTYVPPSPPTQNAIVPVATATAAEAKLAGPLQISAVRQTDHGGPGQYFICLREANPPSVRQARALLAWSQGDLAGASGVSEPTIARLESEDGPVGGRAETGEKLVAALQKAGVTDQFPLCYRCHMLVHCRFQNGPAWALYRDNIRAGTMFAAMTERNFGRFCAETLRPNGSTAAYIVHDIAPTFLPLDDIEVGKAKMKSQHPASRN